MSNPDFNNDDSGRRGRALAPPKQKKPAGEASMPEKTAGWGGLPGKAQSRSRNDGTKKCQVYPKSEGL